MVIYSASFIPNLYELLSFMHHKKLIYKESAGTFLYVIKVNADLYKITKNTMKASQKQPIFAYSTQKSPFVFHGKMKVLYSRSKTTIYIQKYIYFMLNIHIYVFWPLIAGVCQLVNKMDDASGEVKAFNRNDEQFLEAFAIFCGLGIQNTQMYEAVERAMAKQEVTLEVSLILYI